MIVTKQEFIEIIKQNSESFQGESVLRTDQLADLGIDSLGFVMTIYSFEEKLKVKIDDKYLEQLTEISSVGDLIDAFSVRGISIQI